MSLSGVPVVYMSIIRQLHQNYTFDIIIFNDNDMFFEKEFLSFGGKIYKFEFQKPKNFFKKFLWLFYSYPKSVKYFLNKNLNIKDYFVIHSFQEGFSFPFFKYGKKAGINNRILHICSAASAYPPKKSLKKRLFIWYQKKSKKLCTKLIFVSRQSLKYNNFKNKGVVVYNTYNEEKFDKLTPCTHQNLVLTQIGTFSSRKNQLFSLEVVKIIKDVNSNVILNIVGKSLNEEIEKNYLNKMNEYIHKEKLDMNVVFWDPESNREELNKITSYILYPSILESFGLVLIESQASGIHCFANKCIPNDADMGNVDFLELDSKLWADKIIKHYEKNGNNRKSPVNKSKFSTKHFIETFKELYK